VESPKIIRNPNFMGEADRIRRQWQHPAYRVRYRVSCSYSPFCQCGRRKSDCCERSAFFRPCRPRRPTSHSAKALVDTAVSCRRCFAA
jgi:hypothetical protein